MKTFIAFFLAALISGKTFAQGYVVINHIPTTYNGVLNNALFLEDDDSFTLLATYSMPAGNSPVLNLAPFAAQTGDGYFDIFIGHLNPDGTSVFENGVTFANGTSTQFDWDAANAVFTQSDLGPNWSPAPVPEPSVMSFLMLSLLALLMLQRNRLTRQLHGALEQRQFLSSLRGLWLRCVARVNPRVTMKSVPMVGPVIVGASMIE